MKKEWFEPGPDGEIPFVKAALKTPVEMPVWETISAAFRALLAEEQQHDERDALISQLRESLERSRQAVNTTREQRDRFWSQRDAARAEVERLTAELRTCADERMAAEIERDAADEFVKRLTAERDALRAIIDEGEIVYWNPSGWRVTEGPDSTHTARIIYRQPIEERKGHERRVIDASGVVTFWMDDNKVFHTERRVTPGTRADRRAS